ncbi:hypothetical protein GCM10007939_04330 [Amylibacter marinus]|uniref:Sulfatase N-terminal domain-containing protein n=1 Tax=Amylibacter marinus TaxID=1475483 RepID=A0ABQ5VS78_9RHOB|nr:sulfatase [Amylibacter marinus]GLQ34150.1 hypothetical protein GCM10007939_04330 [Amylibacter marinus]
MHDTPNQKQNIILVTVDCWRGDHVGINNPTGPKTPHLDRFAKQGINFPNAYTCGGWTKIAMTALMSSTYGSMYGFAQGKMSDQRPLLAEILQAQGYETAGFTTNPVCGTGGGFQRGFETFRDLRPGLKGKLLRYPRLDRIYTRLATSAKVRRALAQVGIGYLPINPTLLADDVVQIGLDWLNQEHDQPYFLWLHFMDLHWPYFSADRRNTRKDREEIWQDRTAWQKVRKQRGKGYPGDSRAERWRQLYKEEAEGLDTSLGVLFDAIDARADRDNTNVILSGDHGEELYEHGSWAHSWNQLHKEGTNVPLIIRPAKSRSAQSIERPVSHIDLAPTILDMVNVPKPDLMEGDSLLPLASSAADIMEKPIYSEMFGHHNSYIYRLSITYQGHKYIYDGDRDTCYLFDLKQDPDALKDIYSHDHDLSLSFDKLRLSHVSKGLITVLKSDAPILGGDISYDLDADPKVVAQLRALGYLD